MMIILYNFQNGNTKAMRHAQCRYVEYFKSHFHHDHLLSPHFESRHAIIILSKLSESIMSFTSLISLKQKSAKLDSKSQMLTCCYGIVCKTFLRIRQLIELK